MVDYPALAMARLQGSNIKAVRNQGWLNACGVALGVLGAPLDAVAFFDCNYLIETCTEMSGIMHNVCKGIEIYTLNIHFYTHTWRLHVSHHISGSTSSVSITFEVYSGSAVPPGSSGDGRGRPDAGVFQVGVDISKIQTIPRYREMCILYTNIFKHTYTYLCMHK